MLVCVLVGYFALQPFMNAMRIAALEAGSDVGHSAYATRFGILHGVSSLFYLIESLLGVALVWKLPASVGVVMAEQGARERCRESGRLSVRLGLIKPIAPSLTQCLPTSQGCRGADIARTPHHSLTSTTDARASRWSGASWRA